MDEKRVAEIAWKVFDKAKKEHASHSRFALANHISVRSDLSSKTLERVYDRYVEKNGKHGPPNAESIDSICKFLGFENYEAYVKKNNSPHKRNRIKKEETIKSKWITISISIAFSMVFIVVYSKVF